jgi:hypothetical protein
MKNVETLIFTYFDVGFKECTFLRKYVFYVFLVFFM